MEKILLGMQDFIPTSTTKQIEPSGKLNTSDVLINTTCSCCWSGHTHNIGHV